MTDPLSSKHVLTSILNQLGTIGPPASLSGVLDDATTSNFSHQTILSILPDSSRQQAKSVLVTLHFLFPHELLPALDLIDRRLVARLSVTPTSPDTRVGSSPVLNSGSIDVFYVQSASSSSASSHGRFRNVLSKANQYYEVRLDGWNCTCPAFAYSTLRLLMRDTKSRTHPKDESNHLRARLSRVSHSPGGSDIESDENLGWAFGGSATKEDAAIPICKHLLAVALVNCAPGVFGATVVHKNVSKDEMAGWAAGWGEH